MTTRLDAKDEVRYGVSGVKSGYDGPRADLHIPSCGVEDVDTALFNLFDKEIVPMVSGNDFADLKKVPVIFAAGEKWALLKKGKPIRDKTNTLILPLVTIMRTSLNQGPEDVTGRGINQQSGEIVVRRRLDSSDRNYQNLINKLFILGQDNLAVDANKTTSSNQLVTSRKIGSLSTGVAYQSGALLKSNRKNNVFETIVVPSPQFYTAVYQVTVWTQYTQHMNQVIEKLMSTFLPQAQSWKLTSPKGYWFIATVESGNFAIETNFDDMSSSERFIKCNFNLKVPAYIWASSAPGLPIPVKRYVSSPIIDFSVSVDNVSAKSQSTNFGSLDVPGVGSDDPTLPLDDQPNLRDDQRSPGWRLQTVQALNSSEDISSTDPALSGYPRGQQPARYETIVVGNDVKYLKIINQNSSAGETVYSTTNIDGLNIIPVDSI